MSEILQVKYIGNLLYNDSAVEEIKDTIRDEFDNMAYEVDDTQVAIIPKSSEGREYIILQTALSFIDDWRKGKSMRDTDWDLVCAMSFMIQTLIYYSNCTTRREDEILMNDLLEIKRRVEVVLTEIESTIVKQRREVKDE